ncbi:MAG: DUF4384 domain-containing protein, partial [Leptolyngbyaceae cyanobacterium RM1_1_2]|nr:DUF4384 domain-containing protein [Leptolyngbyaceae cyanobacterium RM1_1_2]
MSRLRRRHFLQLAGASLGAIGLNQLDFLRQGDRIHRALAQETPRKLALLIGINGYIERPLAGCANDVRLQYELLVHRYGFNPQDILIVTDANSAEALDLPAREIIATPYRQTIVDAFRDHLIAQAKPGDVAIFHYSGHGSYVNDPQPLDYEESEYLQISGYGKFQGFVGTLVPVDTKDTESADTVNDILGSTVFLLSKLVQTDNFTTILDSCHSGGGVRGNLVYRAIDRAAGQARNPSQAERILQEELMEDLGLTETALKELREAGIARGVAMGSARANQLAAEKQHEGFKAGIFTYLLTRYLWQVGETESLESMFVDLARITRAVDEGGSQDPVYFVQPGTSLDQQPPYLMTPAHSSADAVVREVLDGQTVELWLGGMTPNALRAKDSIYEALNSNRDVIARLQQQGQLNGLKVKAQCIDEQGNLLDLPANLTAGTLLQEEIRGIPTDFSLQVGLHESLGDDSETVRRQLERIDRVTPVTIPDSAADVLMGRFDASIQPQLENLGIRDRSDIMALETGSFGLFKEDLTPLSDTFGAGFESAGEAIARLFSRFRLLLAQQALQSMVNTNSTGLAIDMAIGTVERGGVAVVSSGKTRGSTAPVIPRLTAGENLSLTVTNQESASLFVAVIATEDDGDMYVYHPSDWNAPEIQAELGPGESIEIPKSTDIFELPLSGPSGFFNVLVIASRT